MHEKLLFILVLASAVKRTAATCEHTSPNPAMHVQWADRILPFCLIITQTFKDGNERLCECLIEAVNIYTFGFELGTTVTVTLLIHPLQSDYSLLSS